MRPKKENRPREVTLGAIAVVVLGVLVIARAFDALGGLRSLETQHALRSALDSDSARRLGVTVADLTVVLHALILIGAAGTAVSIVTALFAVTGDRSARWGLFASGAVGGLGALMFEPFFGLGLLLAAIMATVSPRAAIWFGGGTPPPRGGPRPPDDHSLRRDLAGPNPPGEHRPEAGGQPAAPPPTHGFGEYRPPMTTVVPDVRPRAASARPRVEHLPGSARAAVLLTWAACLAVIAAAVGGVVVLSGDRAAMVGWAVGWLDLDTSSISAGQVATGLGVALVVTAGWAALAIAIASQVRTGSGSARMLLVLDAVVAVAAALAVLTSGGISAVTQLVGSVVVLAATATALLLLSPSASSYFGDHHDPSTASPVPPGDRREDESPDKDRLPPAW